ncbi:MAG: class I SAM-dependent methyltransferase [Symplocastrum torsivum CPER-KK1]|jgi:SAM-dependent methyltransferase|uniref:Class I SAM-dependent methyltransferase n=1 Tax=Symplocastrum torsivum CPER-KK1 TaxID=450513 RepID=A0A951PP18_9CYAN|nr:class I SAM-dependent methyltransferase [Symplocastrum torsivum CPER-KK1]
MIIKKIVRNLLPPIVVKAANYATGRTLPRINEKMLQQYLQNGRVPWSSGYDLYKIELITQSISDDTLLRRFRCSEPLSPDYGFGIDERCVEYPWLVANLSENAKCLLDAGSVLNHRFILNHPTFENKKLHILTLAPEENCFWEKGISYLYDDLRDIPIRNDYYDTIICLSTLEHIGCDNTLHTQDETYQENRPEDFVLVMKELRRVLKPGGSLFLSVPFGVYRQLGTFQQFDRELLSRAVEAFELASEVTETFYQYTANGWQIATASDCAECEYVEWVAKAWQNQQFPDPIPVEPDRAAAARAVACIRLVKG